MNEENAVRVSEERVREMLRDDLLDRNVSPRAKSDLAHCLQELLALRAADHPAVGVRVKPLEWGVRRVIDGVNWAWDAKTSIGWYVAATASGERCQGSHFWFISGGTIMGWANSEAEAKAAAFDHYRNAILSCIEPLRPATEQAGGEVVTPDGWVMVPRDATADMTSDAIRHALSVDISSEYPWPQYMADLYRIMLAAAPPSPAATQSAVVSEGVLGRLREVLADADADYADEVSQSASTGERPDLWDREVEVLTEDLRTILAALSNPGASQ